MSSNRVKLIVNPNADLGHAWQAAADLRPIVEELGGADWTGTAYPTHATELALDAAREGCELVIAAGGDGTVHEVINGLMRAPAESRPRLGVVPLGSGNDFAHAVGIDSQPDIALRQAFTGSPRRVDIGRLTTGLGRVEYWDNTIGIGFDTTVTIRSRKFRMVRGFLIYFLAVVQTIILDHEAPLFQVESDQDSWNEKLLMLALCNGGREGGGFNVSPQAVMDDGIFEYTAIRDVSRLMMFRLLPEVMNGTHARFPQVKMGQFKNMKIKSDRPLYIHTDGEIFAGIGSNEHELYVEMLSGALEVMTASE